MTATKQRKPELEAIGRALEEARKALGWSLRKAEEASKVSNGYISQVEQAQVKPSPDVLYKLSQAYGVPLEYLLTKAGYYTPQSDNPNFARVPAWVYSAAEIFDEKDWEFAQGVFRTIREIKERELQQR